MRTLLTLATAVLLAVGAPAAAMAAPVQATAGVPGSGVGIGLLGGGDQISQAVQPGGKIARTVRVSNNTGKARDISVYAGPARMVDGTHQIENRGAANALTTWTSVDKPVVFLEIGGSADVVVTIQVPTYAPATELLGVIWAEVDGSRSGVRMDVTVGGDNGPAADFAITDLAPSRQEDGTAVVAASVTNTGNHPVEMTGTLRLTQGPDGKWLNPVLAHPMTLGAGESSTVLFVIADSASLPNGPWQANASLRNGYFIHDTDKSITFPNKPTVAPEPPAAGSLGSLGSLGLS